MGQVACCKEDSLKSGEISAKDAIALQAQASYDSFIAAKFSEMLGVPEAMLVEALPGLNRCFATRLPGRRLYKPLDLWSLGAFVEAADGTKLGGCGLATLPADVMAELDALKPSTRVGVLAMLQRGCKCGGWLPAHGMGLLAVHKHLPNDEPARHAYDVGVRMFACPDPVPDHPMDAMHDIVGFGRQMSGVDLSRSVLLSSPNMFGGLSYEGFQRSAACMPMSWCG